jgi:hypothetical protein
MKRILDDVVDEVIDVLTKFGPLSYGELSLKLTKTKNDRTFRKVLDILIKNKSIKRKESKDDKRKIIYSIRGFELESATLSISDYDKKLSKYESDLIFMIQKYLEYSKLESNKIELGKYRLKLVKRIVVLLEFIFKINQTVLFLQLIDNIPVLKKTDSLSKIHMEKLKKYLDLLRKHDPEAFKETMAVSILKSNISIPGLV